MRRPEQIPLDLPARSSLARDDLVAGAANAVAVEAVDAWPAWPHPVLLVVGPQGSGKTHLASTWRMAAGARLWQPADREAPDGDAPFAVLVEDVDRLGYDEAGLFALLNAARLGGGTVLMTSRHAAGALEIGLSDLRSRVRAASVAELQAPDEALLAGVVMKLASDRQIEIDPKLAEFALARIERSFAAAAEFVRRVDRAALAGKERIGRGLIQRIVTEMEVETRDAS